MPPMHKEGRPRRGALVAERVVGLARFDCDFSANLDNLIPRTHVQSQRAGHFLEHHVSLALIDLDVDMTATRETEAIAGQEVGEEGRFCGHAFSIDPLSSELKGELSFGRRSVQYAP